MGIAHIVVATGGIGTKALKKDYPNVAGLEGGSTKTHGRPHSLQPKSTTVLERDQTGVY